MPAERLLHFNAFLMSCGHHEAAWRLPESDPSASLDLSYWTNLARIAERGTFDSVFLADGPALWGHARFRPGGALEPTVLLTALVGSHEQVADLIEEYAALGISEFILSGYPHLEEAYWFGEGVLPVLRSRGLLDAVPEPALVSR